ncbi:hypothetical protein H113_04590 [Trichophyton rubrum MR1459]|nr:hypothetical protein H113_04590 [Trichophyton rubrum MR1459]EZG05878.1 hypothetical protein H106_04375 [Trichophyton rubrum CBS 735.88]
MPLQEDYALPLCTVEPKKYISSATQQIIKGRGCGSLYRDKVYRDRHTSITCRAPVVSRIDPYLQVFTMPGLTFWKHWEQRYGMHSPHPPGPHPDGWTLTRFPGRLP